MQPLANIYEREGSAMNRRRKNKQGEKKPFTLLVDTKQLIDSAHLTDSRIELMGNTEAIIEGCQGVLEYDESVIVLSLGKMQIKFEGEDLSLKCMSDTDAIVQGRFVTIEYMH